MKENKEVFKIGSKTKELTIVHKKGLDEQPPISVGITGNIDSPYNWLTKRVLPSVYTNQTNTCCCKDEEIPIHESESSEPTEEERSQIDFILINKITENLNYPNPDNMIVQQEAHILVDREEMSITLSINETNPYLKGSVVGKLVFHPDFEKWLINTWKDWDHETLSEFIKMNRSCFSSRDVAMRLSTELKGLKVKVDKELEKYSDNKGNYRALAVQTVREMSIPAEFKINVPVFKGQKKIEIGVEIYINPNSYRISLVSPEANDEIARVRDEIIDTEVRKITGIAPEIAIIEQ